MKKTVLVIFGGNSNEHEVSLRSASTILSNIDTEKYYVLALGITRLGKWLLYNGSIEDIATGEWEKTGVPAILSPDALHGGILKLIGGSYKLIKVDVCFPVLHGKNGEDGTIQGLFELSGIPFVGACTLSSAVCMDKCTTKAVCRDKGITQTQYLPFSNVYNENLEELCERITQEIGFPCFVKPSAAGSSVGISKVTDEAFLADAIIKAASVDKSIVVEKAVSGREIEVAVIGNDEPLASAPGEIIADRDFYDYDSKYDNASKTKTVVSPELPNGKAEELRLAAVNVYKAVGCSGMARADFFLDENGNVIFNEINTIPGFTSISMFPMLFKHGGTTVRQLIDKLIDFALEDLEEA